MLLSVLPAITLLALARAVPPPAENLSTLFETLSSSVNVSTFPGSLSRKPMSPNPAPATPIICFPLGPVDPPQSAFLESDAISLFWFLLTQPYVMEVADWTTEASYPFPVVYRRGTAYIALRPLESPAHSRFQEVLIARVAALVLRRCPIDLNGYSLGGKALIHNPGDDAFEVILYGLVNEAGTNVTTS